MNENSENGDNEHNSNNININNTIGGATGVGAIGVGAIDVGAIGGKQATMVESENDHVGHVLLPKYSLTNDDKAQLQNSIEYNRGVTTFRDYKLHGSSIERIGQGTDKSNHNTPTKNATGKIQMTHMSTLDEQDGDDDEEDLLK